MSVDFDTSYALYKCAVLWGRVGNAAKGVEVELPKAQAERLQKLGAVEILCRNSEAGEAGAAEHDANRATSQPPPGEITAWTAADGEKPVADATAETARPGEQTELRRVDSTLPIGENSRHKKREKNIEKEMT
jgi:hypothetical protein